MSEKPLAAKPKPPQKPKETSSAEKFREVGGQAGPEPTRYGDWENKGRCTDF